MKLLSPQKARSDLKRQNDDLVDTNIRLRKYEGEVTKRLNTIKDSYEPDKVERLKEFELFVKDINAKKAKLLQELQAIETQIEQKKELYYGLISKQDRLEERIYQADEKEKKLDLREAFVVDLEKKWKDKTE